MKPLTLEETRLKEEMKNNCLKVGKYKDEKAKDKFEMLCHLEDFEVQYWELQQENKKLKDKLSKIETLIINHNCDTGDIYYKYNSRFLKSELKQRILEIVYEEESNSNVKD